MLLFYIWSGSLVWYLRLREMVPAENRLAFQWATHTSACSPTTQILWQPSHVGQFPTGLSNSQKRCTFWIRWQYNATIHGNCNRMLCVCVGASVVCVCVLVCFAHVFFEFHTDKPTNFIELETRYDSSFCDIFCSYLSFNSSLSKELSCYAFFVS